MNEQHALIVQPDAPIGRGEMEPRHQISDVGISQAVDTASLRGNDRYPLAFGGLSFASRDHLVLSPTSFIESTAGDSHQYAMRRGLLHVESWLPAHGVFPDADLIEQQSRIGGRLRSFRQIRVASPTRCLSCRRRFAGCLGLDLQGIVLVGAARHRSSKPGLAYELHL
ncbi:hypothetical protein PQR64_04405 [Paraburkholderia phytofirmans]|uniref:hypothetical protein n=1 Tax=Paraburkholderia phytofirmans TaxID=261302 RepID=UPI0038B87A2A